MRSSNHLDESKQQHAWSREEGYKPAEGEYDPQANQYPKAVQFGGVSLIAQSAEHEAQLKKDHEPKQEEAQAPEVEAAEPEAEAEAKEEAGE